MKNLSIIGAGGHGIVIAELARLCGYGEIKFFDDAWPEKKSCGNWPIIAKPDFQMEEPYFCAVGNNRLREHIFNKFALEKSTILAHPSAIFTSSTVIGNGTVLIAGAIINANSQIGKGVILNTASSIDHDCIIGDFVHISPGVRLGGNVHVGNRSWIGIGAVVRDGIKIGEDVVIGAGAAVVSDIPNGTVVGGVPAKII